MTNSSLYMYQKKQNRHGFTLIELLIVIAILSVLSAILLPILTRVRDSAKRVHCQANLRQIAIAWHLYLQDNNGKFYQGVNSSITFGGWQGEYCSEPRLQRWYQWPRPLNAYVLSQDHDSISRQSAKVFQCPADKGNDSYIEGMKLYTQYGNSYYTNPYLNDQDQLRGIDELHLAINKKLPQSSLLTCYNPTELILVGDGGWFDQQYKGYNWDIFSWKTTIEWHRQCCKYNIAFLDGHVQFTNIKKGIYMDSGYTVNPFRDLTRLAYNLQESCKCPTCSK